MPKLTANDIKTAARHAGWRLAPQRAEQIAAVAAERIVVFERVRARLQFDDDTGFAQVLDATRHPEEGNI